DDEDAHAGTQLSERLRHLMVPSHLEDRNSPRACVHALVPRISTLFPRQKHMSRWSAVSRGWASMPISCERLWPGKNAFSLVPTSIFAGICHDCCGPSECFSPVSSQPWKYSTSPPTSLTPPSWNDGVAGNGCAPLSKADRNSWRIARERRWFRRSSWIATSIHGRCDPSPTIWP